MDPEERPAGAHGYADRYVREAQKRLQLKGRAGGYRFTCTGLPVAALS